ncbi:MAG: hypothetical protein AAB895_01100, partial [Patescibacteria group bacterium]
KIRTSIAHETLDSYVDIHKTKRVKSFSTELKGIISVLTYPENLKEFWWSIELAFARLYMWAAVFYKSKFGKINKIDNWERIDSTK